MSETDGMREELQLLLKEIEDREGRLTPDLVVSTAQDPDHPLHTRFEWDDTKAAHSHRIATARRLIASVQLKVRYQKIVLSAPAYVRDPGANPSEQGYRAVVSLRSDEDAARGAILAEMQRVRAILRRTRGLVLVLGRQEDLDSLEDAVESFVSAMTAGPGSEAPPPSGAS